MATPLVVRGSTITTHYVKMDKQQRNITKNNELQHLRINRNGYIYKVLKDIRSLKFLM